VAGALGQVFIFVFLNIHLSRSPQLPQIAVRRTGLNQQGAQWQTSGPGCRFQGQRRRTDRPRTHPPTGDRIFSIFECFTTRKGDGSGGGEVLTCGNQLIPTAYSLM